MNLLIVFLLENIENYSVKNKKNHFNFFLCFHVYELRCTSSLSIFNEKKYLKYYIFKHHIYIIHIDRI